MISNDDYVKDLYKDYNCISDITAIIGKNSSGKTTSLRIINAIFSKVWLDLEYIIVFESDNKMFCYFNLTRIASVFLYLWNNKSFLRIEFNVKIDFERDDNYMNTTPLAKDLWVGIGGHFDSIKSNNM